MAIFAKKPPAPEGTSSSMDFDLDVDAPPAAAHHHNSKASSNGAAPAYGIADAMLLMRSLPTEGNIELVTRVVRVTLGSVNVKLEDIIDDAGRRQKAIQDRISALHAQVGELEEQLEGRRREITSYEADLKETTSVKERLMLAEKSAAQSPSASGAAPSPVPPSPSGPTVTERPPPPPPPGSRLATLPRATDRD